MDFQLNSEQQMLQDSVRRFVEKDYSFEARTAMLKTGGAGHWQDFADNGWLAAALPDDFGGLGGSLTDTALIAHEFGRGLVLEPFVGCAVLAPQTLLATRSVAHCEHLLPVSADGSSKLALAYSEARSRGFAEPIETRAERAGSGWRITGHKTLVLGGAEADAFIVSAVMPDAQGITLFIVNAMSMGLSRRSLPLHDGTRVAELVLDGVVVSADALVGEPGQGRAAIQQGLAHGVAALCAELVGGMERAIEITAEYLNVRKQFGVPIGSFQALQHRIADMAAELEVARSMLYALLASIENDEPAARQRTVSQAKALIGRAARFVCGQAIQLHGGIGMTEEYSVGHYYKRAVVADIVFGSSDWHEAVCAAQLQESLLR